MTTKKQQMANRRNAKQSTGPRTTRGKAASARNATRHGILSELDVLETESQAAWSAHLDAVISDLQPAGHLETVLAERVALHLWRLARIARFEVAEIGLSISFLPEDGPPLMPRGASGFSIMRYETHIERALCRALQEIRHLQAGRVNIEAL